MPLQAAPMIRRYISKISGPLPDRIYIHIDVPALNYRKLRGTVAPESSADVRKNHQGARNAA
jgi:magnesium chelatase family protein